MIDLTGRPEFKDKIITQYWSDGGPKHFKTNRSILFAIVELPLHYEWEVWPTWNFFVSHHGKSLCDAHASHCKSLFRRLAIEGTSITGAAGYVHVLNNPQTWRKTKEERAALFRKRDEPRPIVAVHLPDSDTTEKY